MSISCNTNADAYETYGFYALFDAFCDRLLLLSSFEEPPVTPSELVCDGYCDPVRVFVKNEPHSFSKISEGRFRLIMNLFVVDQLIERYLYEIQNNLEVCNVASLPVKAGMGLHDAGLLALDCSLSKIKSPLATDAKGFDMGVRDSQLNADCTRRQILTGLPSDSMVCRAMRKRVHCLARSRLVFPDGNTFDQMQPGIQKSGSYNTAATNSWIRYAVCAEINNCEPVGVELAMTMGDDCVESCLYGAERALLTSYAEFGWEIVRGDEIEFCSTSFETDTKWYPQSWAKTVYSYLHSSFPSEELLLQAHASLRFTLRHHPKRVEILSALGLEDGGQTKFNTPRDGKGKTQGDCYGWPQGQGQQ